MQPLDENHDKQPTNNNGDSTPSNEPAQSPESQPSQPEQPAQPASPEQPAPAPKPITDPDEDQPSEALTFDEEVAVDAAIERAEDDKIDRDLILAEIIRRIKSGERAMLVFCTDEDVSGMEAFPLMESEGQLAIGEYQGESSEEAL